MINRLRLIPGFFALALLTGFTAEGPVGPLTSGEVLLSVPDLSTPAFDPCGACDYTSSGNHSFDGAGSDVTCQGSGGDNSCHPGARAGTCFGVHYELCDPLDDDIDYDALEDAALSLDAKRISVILARYPDQVRHNRVRHALQIESCPGRIIVHVQLPAHVEAVLLAD